MQRRAGGVPPPPPTQGRRRRAPCAASPRRARRDGWRASAPTIGGLPEPPSALPRLAALQVAAAKPSFVKREDIPKEVVDKERSIYEGQAKEMGKPPAAWPKIVEGKLEKFYQENCLLEQAFIKDPAVMVKDLLAQKIAKIGENMNIRRFTRYQLGEA